MGSVLVVGLRPCSQCIQTQCAGLDQRWYAVHPCNNLQSLPHTCGTVQASVAQSPLYQTGAAQAVPSLPASVAGCTACGIAPRWSGLSVAVWGAPLQSRLEHPGKILCNSFTEQCLQYAHILWYPI